MQGNRRGLSRANTVIGTTTLFLLFILLNRAVKLQSVGDELSSSSFIGDAAKSLPAHLKHKLLTSPSDSANQQHKLRAGKRSKDTENALLSASSASELYALFQSKFAYVTAAGHGPMLHSSPVKNFSVTAKHTAVQRLSITDLTAGSSTLAPGTAAADGSGGGSDEDSGSSIAVTGFAFNGSVMRVSGGQTITVLGVFESMVSFLSHFSSCRLSLLER